MASRPRAPWRLRALVSVLLAASCGADRETRPSVVLVSVDTLRADRGDASPHMDHFLAGAVSFANAYASEPHTLPSHTSLLTSLHPLSHGVEQRLSGGRALAEHVPTLATVLKGSGYVTAGFINGGYLDPRFGLARGFDRYDYFSDTRVNRENPASLHGRSAAETNEAVFAWLDAHPPDVPFLLFVHYFDVHSDWDTLPYDSPPRYREHLGSHPPHAFGRGPAGGSTVLLRANQEQAVPAPSLVAYVRGLYDAGVRYADDRFGELLDGLARRGLVRDTLLVLVSDHGEEFQEHGRWLHTQLYEECMRVPLGLRFPEGAGAAAGVRLEAVSLIDVMPTVLDYLGIAAPPGLQGRSLWPLIRGGDPTWTERSLLFYSSKTRDLALREAGWKLLRMPGDGDSELYDLRADPQERHDLAATAPDRVAEGLAALRRRVAGLPAIYRDAPPTSVDLDERTIRQLQALGYTE